MLTRRASAVWRGTGQDGVGELTSGSGALAEQPYSARTRFESEDGRLGTNPEELIAAAHAGCFSMALSFALGAAGHPPEEIRTAAELSMSREGVHWTIDAVRLVCEARVPGIGEERFREIAEGAKATCPVSKVLRAEISLEARLA
jgi:osmotically inducible protein OsmC